jgi:heat shock protein HtpX
MNLRAGLLLACAIACLAQTNDDDIDTGPPVPLAYVELTPTLGGELGVTIGSWNTPGLALEALRQATLPCDWRNSAREGAYLRGSCHKYLAGDGVSAQGVIALAPLVAALRRAGVRSVNVSVYDGGHPLATLAQVPAGWKVVSSPGKVRRGGRSTTPATTYWFFSTADTQLPPAFEIHIGAPWQPSRLAVPFGLTVLGPVLLALWLRRRGERKGAPESAAVWLHWMLTANWLYWVSAISLSDIVAFAVHLQFSSEWFTFLTGAAVFVLPPLIATACCIAIMTSAPVDAGEPDAAGGLVKASVAREAAVLVPFAMFLVGASMAERDRRIALASLPLAYFTYRMLSIRVARWTMGIQVALTHGELRASVSALAQRAGVKLAGVYILSNKVARQANAFATGNKIVAMTRGLAERLTRRELNAVIGHELGHLRGKHIGVRITAFWAYILLVGPVTASLAHRAHVPGPLLSLPILPLAYIMATAFLSRRHEFSADAKAAELTGDPEGMIAALARLRKITRGPVDWGGIQGSILSHPSMRDRVLALARRFGVAEERALALLHDPDLLSAGVPPEELRYPLPAEFAGADVLFSQSVKGEYCIWSGWIRNVVVVALTLTVVFQATRMWPHASPAYMLLALLPGIAAAAWLYSALDCWLDHGFLRIFADRLRRRMGPAAENGIFAGLLPGNRVWPIDGFYLWDAGFLWLSPDCLTYRGERTSFALTRESVNSISVEKGPYDWFRAYGVTLACDEGCFTLSRPDRSYSRREVRRLERRLNTWWRGAPGVNFSVTSPAPRPDPGVLAMRWASPSGGRWVKMALKRAVMLWLGFVILVPLAWADKMPALALAQVVAPLAYMLALSPHFFWRRPGDAKRMAETTVAVANAPAPAQS